MARWKPQNGNFSQKFKNHFRKYICTYSLVINDYGQFSVSGPINEILLLARTSVLILYMAHQGKLGHNQIREKKQCPLKKQERRLTKKRLIK